MFESKVFKKKTKKPERIRDLLNINFQFLMFYIDITCLSMIGEKHMW